MYMGREESHFFTYVSLFKKIDYPLSNVERPSSGKISSFTLSFTSLSTEFLLQLVIPSSLTNISISESFKGFTPGTTNTQHKISWNRHIPRLRRAQTQFWIFRKIPKQAYCWFARDKKKDVVGFVFVSFVNSKIRFFFVFFCPGNTVKLLIPIRLQQNINVYQCDLHRTVFISV